MKRDLSGSATGIGFSAPTGQVQPAFIAGSGSATLGGALSGVLATSTVVNAADTLVPAANPAPAPATVVPVAMATIQAAPADAKFIVAVGGNDSGAGTVASPLASINAAINRAQAGDIIMVRDGTYYGQVNIWKGGTDAKPITIMAYPGEHPIIDGHGTKANTDLVLITASNVVVQGFEVQNATRSGIASWNAANVSILDNHVHDAVRGGIYVGGDRIAVADNILIDGNTVHDTVLENQARTASSGWARAIGIDVGSHATVSNNVSYDNFGEGFGALSSTNVTFTGNTAYDNFSVQMYFDNSQNITVTGNTVFETGDKTFYRDGQPGKGVLIANEYTTFQLASRGFDIHDNSFYGVTAPAYDGSYGWGGGLAASNLGPETILPSSQVTVEMLSGHDAVAQSVTPPPVVGTSGADQLTGTPTLDVIAGLDGTDQINGRADADTILGGLGNDKLVGSAGDDNLYGGGGKDRLAGGGGNDMLSGGTGSDQLYGGDGDDTLYGDQGSDRLDGGPGTDVLYGGSESDRFIFRAGYGADRIVDIEANDKVLLDNDLWTGKLTEAQVVSRFGSVTSSGIVLDFGHGDMLTVAGMTDTSALAHLLHFI